MTPTRYTLKADGLTIIVTLTDDPAVCAVEVGEGDGKRVRLPIHATTALRELRRAISTMLDHRAILTRQED
jgi:hypothetical protein